MRTGDSRRLPSAGTTWSGTVALLIGVGLPLLGCSDAETAEADSEAPTKPVEIEILTPRSFTSWVHASGLVEAESRMSLAFRIDGTIHRYHVEEGDFVEAGGVIAELDSRDTVRGASLARAAVESAAARAAEAKRELDRQERLMAAKTTSTQAHESARSSMLVATAEVSQTRLQLEAAETALADCQLRAPVAGYIERRLLEKHEFASIQRPVVILTQLERVKVRTSVADRLLAVLEPGAEAKVRSSAWPGREFDGKVVRIAMAADPKTHTLPLELLVPNADLALRPAMVVEVALKGGKTEDLLTVPMKAVVRDGGLQPLCFVVTDGEANGEANADGASTLRAESRPVVLGRLWGDRIGIEAGLTAGDRVIVEGQHFVRAGDAIHIVEGKDSQKNRTARIRAER